MYGTRGNGYLFRRIEGQWGLFCLPLKEKAAAMRGRESLHLEHIVGDVCKEVMGGYYGFVPSLHAVYSYP